MFNRLSLRSRIYLILTALVITTSLGGAVLIWYTYRMEIVLSEIIDHNLAAYQSALALETSLVNQKGFVSYYLLDHNPDWLRQLGEYRQVFKERLKEAQFLAEGPQQEQAVKAIDRIYHEYVREKDRVIAYYQSGQDQIGLRLHQQVRSRFSQILNLCNRYKDLHNRSIQQAKIDSRRQAARLRFMAGAAVFLVCCLGLLLAFLLASQILDPVRRLLHEAGRDAEISPSANEVKALSRSVHGLIEDAGQTHIALERSREHLLQAEKMALVGKLAAGMAHSIRNPLTSVKMRLFSLHRSLNLNADQREDFEVISEEIRHTDTIVQNFLEFSRPPKLKMQTTSPSLVVDLALQLLEHRLKSYDVEVRVIRTNSLPEIEGDPEQLKEVLVNLMVNACEAMANGGSIRIYEEQGLDPSSQRVAVIRLTDNGPGIPEHLKEKIFEPFFTTKDEGTGLGLSIAARIVEEHRGRLEMTSIEGEGTTFTITLPIKEQNVAENIDH